MIDRRIGVGIDPAIDDQLAAYCKKHKVSKGAFLTAMLTTLDAHHRDAAVIAYRERRDTERKIKKQARAEIDKKLRELSVEDIKALLESKSAPKRRQGDLLDDDGETK